MIMDPEVCWPLINRRPWLGIGGMRPPIRLGTQPKSQFKETGNFTRCPSSSTGIHKVTVKTVLADTKNPNQHNMSIAIVICDHCGRQAYAEFDTSIDRATRLCVDVHGNVWDGMCPATLRGMPRSMHPHTSADFNI
jgi:hypothetical protein